MNTIFQKKNSISGRIARWFRLCPARHLLTLLGGTVIGCYFALRGEDRLMDWAASHIVRPWHRFFGRLCGGVSFSVGEMLIALGVIAALACISDSIVRLIRSPGRGKTLYRLLMTCLTAFSLIYGGFCLLWGVYYYTADFEENSGIRSQLVSVEQLTVVTRYFTDLVNEYDTGIARDADGSYAESTDYAFDRSSTLYDAAAAKYPCLDGDALRAKPVLFSRVMSCINFTGFFFPFTGEANINTDCPACLIPSTIAHELAHQRGIAAEDEANFAAVLASLESGDPVFCYSSCLLAYIYLSNALYRADYDAWSANYDRLASGPRTDLRENNAYWEQFETPVSTVSDAVYTGFLQSYGQELGLQTYGKCVDLLVAYYYETALEAAK